MARGWSVPPTAFIGVVEDDLIKRRKEMTATALQAVISGSPVDTGAYKANHRVTLDGVDLGYDLGAKDPSGSKTQSDGDAVIAAIDTPFGTSTIQNNLPYAEALEDGHSMKSPQGVYGPAMIVLEEKYTR